MPTHARTNGNDIHARTRTDRNTQTHHMRVWKALTPMHAHNSVHTYTSVRRCTYPYMCKCVRTYTYTYGMHTCAHKYMYVPMHQRTYAPVTRAHTHTPCKRPLMRTGTRNPIHTARSRRRNPVWRQNAADIRSNVLDAAYATLPVVVRLIEDGLSSGDEIFSIGSSMSAKLWYCRCVESNSWVRGYFAVTWLKNMSYMLWISMVNKSAQKFLYDTFASKCSVYTSLSSIFLDECPFERTMLALMHILSRMNWCSNFYNFQRTVVLQVANHRNLNE